jgi:hypothetical protein
MERWVEAIVISMQTAREAKLSLTGACKNIARLVTAFDIQKEVFNAEQVELLNRRVSSEPLEWGKDCQSLLEACTEEGKEIVQIFDACLALRPQRQDIIRYYMELTHPHILKLLGEYWEWRAIKLTPFETLHFIDWTYTYHKQLQTFGIRDDSLYNGFVILCNAYATKI